jgi:hypothetical protein
VPAGCNIFLPSRNVRTSLRAEAAAQVSPARKRRENPRKRIQRRSCGTSLYFVAAAKISGCTACAAAPAAPTITFNSSGIFTGGKQVVSLQA